MNACTFKYPTDGQGQPIEVRPGHSTTKYFDYYIGSCLFSLSFDEEKFRLDSIHTPYFTNYVSSTQKGGEIAIVHKVKGTTLADVKMVSCNKGGGIFFTGLEPSSLWRDTMGFGGNQVSIIAGKELVLTTSGTPKFIEYINNGLQDGINVTGADTELDSAIEKVQADGSHNFLQVQNELVDRETITDSVSKIYAENPYYYNILKNSGGYYLVEINLGVTTVFSGEKRSIKNIFAICSSYYKSDNFLIINGEDGVMYQHEGSPICINSIRTRILGSNGNVAPSLDINNTIFLSLIKQKIISKDSTKN